ncbi:MAG TPA: YXWGXW repeat-containing protein [Burkholderiales bacterium]|nr:YXWGXW repeat-containing protein [Burkholderiales bacterium]
MSKTKTLILGTLLALGSWAVPASAVNLSIGIDVGPPPAQVEVIPPPRAGFVWAPGYWDWEGSRHVWVAGHWLAGRPGFYWVPERWEQHAEERGHHWHFEPGHWEKNHGNWERDPGRHR